MIYFYKYMNFLHLWNETFHINHMPLDQAKLIRAMLADRGYNSDNFRYDLLIHGMLPVNSITQRPKCAAAKQTGWCYGDLNPLQRDSPILHEFPQSRRREALD
ncbi:hypothetical protein [Gluconobacter sp. OJB]|uniref:hypothetical protein n=1 Tax=Gluconobacter sp. OJB TaxID=3145196 RepID=UPI0031F915BA